MRTATPLWKVFARAAGAVVLVFALVIGVLAVFGDDSKTQATSVQVKGKSVTRDTSAPTSTAPATTTPTTAPAAATPTETAPPATNNSGSTQTQTQTAAPQPAAADPAPAPAPDPGPPPPTTPPLNPRVRVSGAGGQLNVQLTGFAPNSSVFIQCSGIDDLGKYFPITTASTTTDGSGNGSAICVIPVGAAPFVFAEAGGAHSNHLSWS